jgi:hypothetical protein
MLLAQLPQLGREPPAAQARHCRHADRTSRSLDAMSLHAIPSEPVALK